MPIIDLAFEKAKARAEGVAKLMDYVRALFVLEKEQLDRTKEAKESGIKEIARPNENWFEE
jgi:translation initiation factor IF-3